MSQTSYLPTELVVFTLSGCHRYAHTRPYKLYRLSDQQEELIYSPPSEPISPSVTICFATWRWDHLIASDQTASPGVYRVRVETVDAAPQATAFSADFVLEDPNAGQPIVSCPAGCGGLQATANAGGGLDIGYTNLTGQVLDTRVLSYTVERSVEDQWGVVFGPEPVPTSTLTLAPGQSLTWSWQATDNQNAEAPAGEYRVVLMGTGSPAASGSEAGGVTPGTPPRVRTSYYYLGGQRVGMRQGVVGQAGEVYYLHVDHLGSTSETTSATGGRIAQERYYPYGQVRWGSAPTSYNFTGQRLDGTGLLYYGARYYHPALMRFLSADSIVPRPSNPQTLNRYAYTVNNPLRYTDPSGHIFETIWDIASIIWDIGEVINDPSAENVGALIVDVGAAVIPAVPAVGGAIVRGSKVVKAAAEVATHTDEVVDVAKVLLHLENAAGAVKTLSRAAAETIQRYGIKAYGEITRPLAEAGQAAHHLVEKRFWRQLGFKTAKDAEDKILAVVIDQGIHGPAGKGMATITDRIRDEIGYRLSADASPQRI